MLVKRCGSGLPVPADSIACPGPLRRLSPSALCASLTLDLLFAGSARTECAARGIQDRKRARASLGDAHELWDDTKIFFFPIPATKARNCFHAKPFRPHAFLDKRSSDPDLIPRGIAVSCGQRNSTTITG